MFILLLVSLVSCCWCLCCGRHHHSIVNLNIHTHLTTHIKYTFGQNTKLSTLHRKTFFMPIVCSVCWVGNIDNLSLNREHWLEGSRYESMSAPCFGPVPTILRWMELLAADVSWLPSSLPASRSCSIRQFKCKDNVSPITRKHCTEIYQKIGKLLSKLNFHWKELFLNKYKGTHSFDESFSKDHSHCAWKIDFDIFNPGRVYKPIKRNIWW